jgi:hypothetical protein
MEEGQEKKDTREEDNMLNGNIWQEYLEDNKYRQNRER